MSFLVLESLSTSPVDTDSRVVRFDSECVLIPDYPPSPRRTRVVTKSYSLPLWKRRSQPLSDSEGADDNSLAASSTFPPLSSSPEETHVVIKVPIPSFVRRSSRSPNGARSPTSPPTIPLSPCLVHRSVSAPVSSPSSVSQSPATRRPALPIYQRRKDDPTVPLRACCPDCVPITEESLKEGSSWQEKFTKGARRRRRSASLDNPTSPSLSTTVTKPAFTPSLYDARMPPPTLAITVDEVDKRRKSQEFSLEERVARSSTRHTTTTSTRTLHQYSAHERENDAGSSSQDSERQHETQPRLKRKSSPIAEEDENELFPLPSPRRSPNASPSSSTGPSPKQSPTPSPNASTACLHPSSAATISTAAMRGLRVTDSEEMLANGGISRKDAGKGRSNEFAALTPPQSGSSTPRAHKPTLTLTTLSLDSSSFTKFPSGGSRGAAAGGGGGDDTAPNSPTTPISALASSLGSLTSSISTTSSTQPKSPITPATSPRMSGGKTHRKHSFTLPFLKATEVIKGASVDVLKGVSSIGGGGGGLMSAAL